MLVNPDGTEFNYALYFEFNTTNNEAEYEALLAGLKLGKKIGVQNLQVHVDSMSVANQTKNHHVSRSKNKKADALSRFASV